MDKFQIGDIVEVAFAGIKGEIAEKKVDRYLSEPLYKLKNSWEWFMEGQLLLVEKATKPSVDNPHVQQAEIAQKLKAILREADEWGSLSPLQRESLDMIMHSIGGILCGDISCWGDIAEYARLGEEMKK